MQTGDSGRTAGNLLSDVGGVWNKDKREDRNMEIQMYNMGLGECFLLEDGTEKLAVNCGTRNKRINGTDSGEIYREIQDRAAEEGYDLLITQFDPEHISGFLQTGRVRPGDGIRTVYLPDLFSERWMNEVLALLLLQDLSRGGFLPGKAVTLTSMMEVLLTFPGRLCFLKRGESIGGRYQVLWPQKDGLKAEMEQTLKSAGILDAFYEQDRCMWRELVRVSSRMREIYMRLLAISRSADVPRNEEGIPVELEEDIKNFRSDFRKLRRNERFLGMVERCQKHLEILKAFHDRTGLIFHTREDGSRNFLYTGNTWKERAAWLAANEDGLAGLHREYWCITLPGHGTDACYWDFSEYAPKHFLVSNGYVAGQENGKVSGRYSGMFAVPDVTMHCTSADWCEGRRNGICSCWSAQITSPHHYSVIR